MMSNLPILVNNHILEFLFLICESIYEKCTSLYFHHVNVCMTELFLCRSLSKKTSSGQFLTEINDIHCGFTTIFVSVGSFTLPNKNNILACYCGSFTTISFEISACDNLWAMNKGTISAPNSRTVSLQRLGYLVFLYFSFLVIQFFLMVVKTTLSAACHH